MGKLKHKHNRTLLAKTISLLLAGMASTTTLAADNKDDADIERIEVRGIAASSKENLNSKRFSNSVIDSITAEDIGKLPDVTIADTLQRIPGVQIRREAGEGSTANIRGIPQVATLLNGEQFLSAGSITSVQPDFADIPSALISGIDVIKSPTASTLAGGISGTLDLKTRRPFDLDDGYTFAASAEGTRGSISKTDDSKFTIFGGYNADKFGIIFTAAYDQNTLANNRHGTILNSTEVLHENERDMRDYNGDGDNNDSFYSQRFLGNMNRETERERLGLSTSFQYEFNDNFEFIGDIFYTKMEDADRFQGVMVDNSRGNNWAFSDQYISRGAGENGGDLLTVNKARLDVRRVSSYSEARTNDRESTNINLELKYNNGGDFSGSVRYLRGDAERSHTENVAHSFLTSGAQHGLMRNDGSGAEPVNPKGVGPGTVPVTLDKTGKYITLGFEPGFGSDISQYNLVSTYSERNFEEEATLDVLRLDGSYELDQNHLTSIDFGIRTGKREADRVTSILVAPFSTGDFSADVMWKDSGASLGDTNGDGENSVAGGDLTLGNLNYFTDLPDGWVHQANTGSNNNFYLIDPKVLENNVAFQNAIYPGNKSITNPSDTYTVTEETQTVYAQLNFAGDIGGYEYNANAGVQYINTDLEVVSRLVGGARLCSLCTASGDLGFDVVDRSYSDVLPAANISVNITPDVIVRAAYAKTLTSQDLDDLAGGLSVGRTRAGDVLAAELGVSPDLLVAINGTQNGNPELEPWRADNFNLSAEWYFSDSGLLSLGLFKIDLETTIENGEVQKGLADLDGVVRRVLPVATNVNGKSSTIDGIEVAYQQAFDFLPGFWSGFGTALNFTYAPSESANFDFYGKELPVQDNSERSANAVLWYEKDGFQFRIAGNYRSDRLDRVTGPLTPGNDVNEITRSTPFWVKPTFYVDISASYDINETVNVFVSGSNITEEFEEVYAQWEDNVVTQNVFESRWTVGARVRF